MCPGDRPLGRDLEDLGSVPGSVIGLVGDLGQVVSALYASVFPSVNQE